MTVGWLVFAIGCGILEIATPAFGFVLVAGAAVFAAIAAASGFSLLIQFVVFAGACGVLLIGLRPYILSRMEPSPGVPSRMDRLIGKVGRVTESIDPATGGGRILVEGHDWAAASGEPISAGTDVRVEGADGNRLAVRRL